MRSAKATDNFPYKMSTLCYFEVDKAGKVTQIPHKNKSDLPGVATAYARAVTQATSLYAVWPGNWSSDLFLIDSLEQFAKAFDLK